MHVSKPVAILVLFATLVPLAYLVFFIATIAVSVLSDSPGGPEPTLFKMILLLHLICMVWLWALIAFYLVYLFKSSVVPKDQQLLWAIVLIFFNMFAMPVFWFLYIRPSSRQSNFPPTHA